MPAASASATAFDQRQLRNALGAFVTGVTIITTRDAEGLAHGVTANSFSSLSLDPPLVLWSQALTSKSLPAFRDSDHFAVNILSDEQTALSNHFAKSRDDKFQGIAYSEGLGGVPVLTDTAAHLECVKVASYPGGDHVLYVGRVERLRRSNRRPLAFGSGRYMVAYAHELGPVSLMWGNAPRAHVSAIARVVRSLPELSSQLGHYTLCLSVWGNHGPTVVHWEPSQQPVSDNLRTGLVMSVTRSATGRAFAAFLPPEVTRPFIDEDLRLFLTEDDDEATLRARFDDEVADARRLGMARSTAAGVVSPLHQVAVNAFSAPVFNEQGDMVMALSVTSPEARLATDHAGAVPVALARAARALSGHAG